MRRAKRFIALMLAFLMIISAVPSAALTAFAEGYYNSSIEGTIVDSNGNGVSQISVLVYDITEKEVINYYQTDAKGRWNSGSECVSGNQYLISYYHRDYTFSTNKFIVEAITGTLTLDTVTATKRNDLYTESDSSLFTYEILNGLYIKILTYTGAEETVVIPSEIDGYIVQSVGDGVFRENKTIKTVVFPDTVISIGSSIFYKCTNLEEVKFSAGLKTIGDYAFAYCTGIKDLSLPNTLNTIGSYAFRDCTGLTTVDFPDSVTTIYGDAFRNCSNLESITYPMAWTTAGSNIFYNCPKLTTIVVPEGVTAIPNNPQAVSAVRANFPLKSVYSSSKLLQPSRRPPTIRRCFSSGHFSAASSTWRAVSPSAVHKMAETPAAWKRYSKSCS